MFNIFNKNKKTSKEDTDWYDRSWKEIEQKVNESYLTNDPDFCIYCGSFIPEHSIRSIHVRVEHSNSIPEFCICCGQHIGSENTLRMSHYNKAHESKINYS